MPACVVSTDRELGRLPKTPFRSEEPVWVCWSARCSRYQRVVVVSCAGAVVKAGRIAGRVAPGPPLVAAFATSDMTEDVVRYVALPMGLVDNKVCAVDEVWSGLRVVWRVELRPSKRRAGM